MRRIIPSSMACGGAPRKGHLACSGPCPGPRTAWMPGKTSCQGRGAGEVKLVGGERRRRRKTMMMVVAVAVGLLVVTTGRRREGKNNTK